VASVGGIEKQYSVAVDPLLLRAFSVTMEQVLAAVAAANKETGAGTLEVAGHEYMVRGRGYLRGVEDLEKIALRSGKDGVPVLLSEVAKVRVDAAPRRGLAEWNGKGETVAGIVIMRHGENALRVIDAVKVRLDELRGGLPDGVRIEVAYDRSELIRAAIDTTRTTLLEEMLVVALVIFLFLLHARSALVAVITLPVAVLLAFIPMYYQGLTANIMSLGGIAVAIGAMVDAAIIMIENVHKRLEDAPEDEERSATIVSAMIEVGPSIFFSLMVITVSFIPVFTLEATEGRLFKPLAFTKTYAMGFSAILAVTLTPALAVLLIRGRVRSETAHPLTRLLRALYAPVVRWVVYQRWLVIALALLAMLLTVPAFMRLQTEFMPPLNEGAILYMPSAPPGMSIGEAAKIVQTMDAQLMAVPEVISVLGKMGRANTATDPAPIGMAETTVMLKPKSEWRPGLTWDALIAELDAKLQIPGMPNIWWMPIQTRTEMLATGIRSPVAVQLFGDDLAALEHDALKIEKVLGGVAGTRSAFAERTRGGFYVDVDVDRTAAARHGLSVAAVHRALRQAVGGIDATHTVEGRKRFAVNVKYGRGWRADPNRFDQILVRAPNGADIPLTDVAAVKRVNGPPMVRSEDGQIASFVFVDPGDTPVGAYVEAAQRAVAEQVKLSPGVRLAWTGQYRYLQRAQAKLAWVVPLTLGLVILLLLLNTKSWVETGIVLLAVPFSLIGAIWLVYLLDYNMSVAVWVGLIALAGLDAETGVVMLLYLKLAYRRAAEAGALARPGGLTEAIVDGAAGRIRPKLMTVLTTMIALAPILWSVGVGADVMKRIAAPMVGGLVTSFFLELTVYPALFAVWKQRDEGPG
jgi:Cu(I)/Ag(I) efflux system membrane protein CusA/SilA